MTTAKIVLGALSLACSVCPVWPETRSAQLLSAGGIAENSVARGGMIDELTKPVRQVRPEEAVYEYADAGGGRRIKYKTMLTGSGVYYLFMNRRENGYPEAARGNYLIRRNRASGRFESILVFYRDEPGCYLEITPYQKQSRLNVYLFNRLIYRDLSLPFTVEILATEPLATVVESTRGVVEWEKLLFLGGRPEDATTVSIIEAIRAELPRVREAVDGALDRDGRFVTIADGRPQKAGRGLNCSGFAKWIVDGFYFPIAGRCLDIGLLKTKHPESRGNRWSALREADEDPYFGLDWTRNLATALQAARTGVDEPASDEACDVRQVPFFSYEEDSGYRIDDLYHVLFFLAVDEPGTAYLGAVNDINPRQPVAPEYFHVAAFFPYFDEKGRFRVVVMDQHKNPDIALFMKKYPDTYVHLVRFGTDSTFSLFHIE